MPELVYNVRFEVGDGGQIAAPVDASSKAEVQQLREEIEELKSRNDELIDSLTTLEETTQRVGQASGGAANRTSNLGTQSGKTGKRIGDLNKQTAAFNQTIFAFGDLAQDSIQFQYGFATGMRAIGNNIGFAAELFANASLNVRRYNEAVESGAMAGAQKVTVLGAFVKSLGGVGGLILAVNAATTVLTLYTQRLEDAKKEAKKGTEVLQQYANAIESIQNILGADPLNVRAINIEMTALKNVVASNAFSIQESLDDLKESRLGFMDAFEGALDALDVESAFNVAGLVMAGTTAALTSGLDLVSRSSLNTARAMGILAGGISANARTVGALANTISGLEVNLDGTVTTYDNITISVSRANELLEEMNEELERQELLLSLSPLLRYQKDITETVDKLVLFNKAGLDNEDAIRAQIESLKDERQELVNISKDFEVGSDAMNIYAAMINILSKNISSLDGILDKASGSLKNTTQEVEDLSKRIREATHEFFNYGVIEHYGESTGQATSLIEEQREELIALRGELASVTSNTDLTADQIRAFTNDFERLLEITKMANAAEIDAFARALSQTFAPDLTESQKLTQVYEENRQAIQVLISQRESEGQSTQELEQYLKDLTQGYRDASDALRQQTIDEYNALNSSEQALLDYGRSYQQATDFLSDHRQALSLLPEDLKHLEEQYASLAAQNLAESILGGLEEEDPFTKLERQIDSAAMAFLRLRQANIITQEQFSSYINRLDDLGITQKELIRGQQKLNDLQAGINLANAIGQLGEVFGASKQFQYAMAVISGSAAIVAAMGDKSFTTVGRLANAAAIAAAVAVQIKQIKDTDMGSTSSFQQPSASFGAGSSMTEATPPQQNISFAPTAQSDGMTLNITNEVVATPKGLAIITRNGEREIANSQKSVR